MRHRSSRLRLPQKPAHAALLQKNLVTSLILFESIRTTRKRARVIQPIVDRLISTAKKNVPYNAIRAINTMVTDKNASRKVMEVLLTRYATRPSGFTRMKAVGARKGDGAQLVDLTMVDADKEVAPVAAKAAAKKAAPKKKSPATDESAPASAT